MDSLFTQIFPAPPGDLLLGDWQGALVLCDWLLASNGHRSDSRVPRLLGASLQEQATPLLTETAAQLAAFFTGKRRGFDLPLCLVGTPGAIRSNPLSVVVPCHRVIGKNGGLTGYNGGTAALYIKERLLALERGARELGLA